MTTKIDKFYITFDRRWSAYKPGDSVAGQVTLKLNQRFPCAQVHATLFGAAKVLWVERDLPHQVAYTNERIVCNERQQLWALGQDDKQPRHQNSMASGSYQFSFKFQLPESAPTSFNVERGPAKIEYWIKVCLADSSNHVKALRKSKFCVVCPLDFNAENYRSYFEPKESKISIQKMCKRMKLSSQAELAEIAVTASLSRSAYVPGESIDLQINLTNHAKKPVKYLKAQLIQMVSCLAEHPEFKVKETEKEVSAVSEKVRASKEKSAVSWSVRNLLIPAVVPTFEVESVVEVRYAVRVQCLFQKRKVASSVDLPISVGTVQRKSIEKEANVAHNSKPHVSGHNGFYVYDNLALEIPPPTYEETVANAYKVL